jgi:uncharacterized protein
MGLRLEVDEACHERAKQMVLKRELEQIHQQIAEAYQQIAEAYQQRAEAYQQREEAYQQRAAVREQMEQFRRELAAVREANIATHETGQSATTVPDTAIRSGISGSQLLNTAVEHLAKELSNVEKHEVGGRQSELLDTAVKHSEHPLAEELANIQRHGSGGESHSSWPDDEAEYRLRELWRTRVMIPFRDVETKNVAEEE